jgi:ATP-dependent Lhr-like helicase
MSTFSKLHPLLQTQIVERLGWTSLRPVQELAGEAIFNQKNCIILAPTAGGKTESAFFPVLSELIDISEIGIKAIYLSPIKALLNNIEPRVEVYTSMVGLSHFKWHGDISQGSRNKFIKEPGDVLLTTPESIEVMLVSSKVNKNIFKPLRYIIIDEIHAFAAVDRGIHLLSVLERLKSIIQTDFFYKVSFLEKG